MQALPILEAPPPSRRARALLRRERMGEALEALRGAYGAAHLASDPVEFPHRYAAPEDREIVALLAASLAYGGVKQIRASVSRLLGWMGPRPARFVDRFDLEKEARRLGAFKHRWNTADDVLALLLAVRRMRERAGTVGGFFRETFDPGEATVRGSLSRFVRRARALDLSPLWPDGAPEDAYFSYFFPDPEDGSPCKRLNLFLRWAARPADGVDLGLWPWLPTRALVVPLDTHVARIARRLRLTRRKTAGWRMAEEVTASLRRFDPEDPVKYDFALARLGILDLCAKEVVIARCKACYIRDACAVPGRWRG